METWGFHDNQAKLHQPASYPALTRSPSPPQAVPPTLFSAFRRAAHCTPARFRMLFTSISLHSLGCLPQSQDCALITTSYPCAESDPCLEDSPEQTESRMVPEQGPWSCGPRTSINISRTARKSALYRIRTMLLLSTEKYREGYAAREIS